MSDPLPYLCALAALGILWDGLRRWTDAQTKRTDAVFVTRAEHEDLRAHVEKRCNNNKDALESHAKHAGEFAQKVESRFNAMALQRGRVA